MLPEDLRAPSLAAALQGGVLGESQEVVGVAESTMDLAWAARDRGAPHGHLVVADRQRAVRGSYGRRWTSPGGSDLYFSLLLRPDGRRPPPPDVLAMVPLAAGLAVADEARRAGRPALVKWPNDVVVPGPRRLAKLAGSLVEARAPAGTATPDLVVGVGLNVGRQSFPDFGEGHLPGTSLALEGVPASRPATLRGVLDALAVRLARRHTEGAAALAAAVAERLWARGEEVLLTVEGRPPELCTLRGLAPDGALRVASGGEERAVRSGRLAPAQYQ